ncbi:MAG: AI-2E family transporter [Candidatus Aminicenantes bacterium]|nr:MAG: AI-2E family transporter [Candidatus Aminicenantes bacterium]
MDEDRFLKAAIAVIVLFVVGVVLKLARPILIPFILAVFLSYIIDPALTFLTRCRCPRREAVILVMALMFVFFFLLGALIYSSGKSLASELPRYQERLSDISVFLTKGIGAFKVDLSALLGKLEIEKIGAFILSVIGPFFSVLSKLLLVFLFLIFIVSGRGRAAGKIQKALGDGRSGRIKTIIEAINAQTRKYILIKTALSVANGLIVWVVLAIFGVDFAPLFGLVAFLLNFIPDIGSLVATVLRVGFAFFQFGTFWPPFWILVITVGLDSILGYFVEPKIMGQGLGLSPLLVFFSLLFWGWLWGIPGMILSVPLTAVIKIVCQNVPALRPVAVLMGS